MLLRPSNRVLSAEFAVSCLPNFYDDCQLRIVNNIIVNKIIVKNIVVNIHNSKQFNSKQYNSKQFNNSKQYKQIMQFKEHLSSEYP